MVLEIFAKEGRVREIHKVGYFLNGHNGVFQQRFGFQYHIFVNPFSGSLSAYFLYYGGEMLGTQEQLFRIKIHASFFTVVFGQQVDELDRKSVV